MGLKKIVLGDSLESRRGAVRGCDRKRVLLRDSPDSRSFFESYMVGDLRLVRGVSENEIYCLVDDHGGTIELSYENLAGLWAYS